MKEASFAGAKLADLMLWRDRHCPGSGLAWTAVGVGTRRRWSEGDHLLVIGGRELYRNRVCGISRKDEGIATAARKLPRLPEYDLDGNSLFDRYL